MLEKLQSEEYKWDWTLLRYKIYKSYLSKCHPDVAKYCFYPIVVYIIEGRGKGLLYYLHCIFVYIRVELLALYYNLYYRGKVIIFLHFVIVYIIVESNKGLSY